MGNFNLAAEYRQPVTQAAPPISALILSMSLLGLIEIPPVSNVTPLPGKNREIKNSKHFYHIIIEEIPLNLNIEK